MLQSDDFEKAYADFIDGRKYDEAQDLLFSLVRTSFAGGWQAAGGDPPTPYRVFEVLSQKDQESENDTRWTKKKKVFKLLAVLGITLLELAILKNWIWQKDGTNRPPVI